MDEADYWVERLDAQRAYARHLCAFHPERTRTWIDLLGALFCLVPMCIVLIYVTWPWFLEAWANNETSQNAGGLPRWPVKLILPVGFFFVLLQGISEIIKCLAALTTDYVREHAYEKPVQ